MKAFLTSDEPAPTYTKGFWIGLALGLPIVGYGVRGVLDALPGVQLTSFLRYFVGAAIIHDLILGPLVCLVGWAVLRGVPAVAKGPVQAALVASGTLALVAWPFVRGYGITPGEPSFLSRNYTASLLIAWAVVWGAAALLVGLRVVSARRR